MVTPSPKVAVYERWSRNVNWWFYRELYRWYAPVANTFNSGGMHLFWQRTGVCNDLQQPARVDWKAQDNTVTLTVTTEDPTFNGGGGCDAALRLRGGRGLPAAGRAAQLPDLPRRDRKRAVGRAGPGHRHDGGLPDPHRPADLPDPGHDRRRGGDRPAGSPCRPTPPPSRWRPPRWRPPTRTGNTSLNDRAHPAFACRAPRLRPA